jgi:hypothetical protein
LSYTRLLVSAAERLPQRDRAGQCFPARLEPGGDPEHMWQPP